MKKKSVQLFSLTLIMLVTGVFWGTWFTLTRSIETFTAPEFIHIGQTIIGNVAWPMRILMPACIAFMALSLWMERPRGTRTFNFLLVSLVLMIISLLITLIIEVPIDNMIRNWTAETIPADWHTLREKWNFYHAMRTFTSITSFILFLSAYLFTESRRA